MADEVVQQEHSNIKYYVLTFRGRYIYIYIRLFSINKIKLDKPFAKEDLNIEVIRV